MKLQIKALSLTLVLASMLGACSSVNSSTPSVEDPSVNSPLELESSEGIEGLEEVPTDSATTETTDFGTREEPTAELDSTEIENSGIGSSEEPTAEIENSDLDSAGTENSPFETVEQGTPEIESSEAPIESQGSEVILPVEDAAQTPTESEAADNSTLEPAQ